MSEKRDWGLEITNLTQAVYQLILAALLSKLFSARVVGAIKVLSGPEKGDDWALMWTLLQVTLWLGIPLIIFELKKTGSLGRAFFELFLDILPISAALTFPIGIGPLSFVYLGLGIYNLVQYFDGWKKLWKIIFKRSGHRRQVGPSQPPQTEERPTWRPVPSRQAENKSTGADVKLTVPVEDNERLRAVLPEVKRNFPLVNVHFEQTKDKQIAVLITGENAQLAKRAIERLLQDQGNKGKS